MFTAKVLQLIFFRVSSLRKLTNLEQIDRSFKQDEKVNERNKNNKRWFNLTPLEQNNQPMISHLREVMYSLISL